MSSTQRSPPAAGRHLRVHRPSNPNGTTLSTDSPWAPPRCVGDAQEERATTLGSRLLYLAVTDQLPFATRYVAAVSVAGAPPAALNCLLLKMRSVPAWPLTP